MIEELVKRLQVLKKYYDSKIEDVILIMWAEDLLEFYDMESIKKGIKAYRMNEKYPPTLAGIIEYIPIEKIDYAELLLFVVRKYGSCSSTGINYLTREGDQLALLLYKKYGNRIGMSQLGSTNQKFLFKEINEEAESQIKYNTFTVGKISSDGVKKISNKINKMNLVEGESNNG